MPESQLAAAGGSASPDASAAGAGGSPQAGPQDEDPPASDAGGEAGNGGAGKDTVSSEIPDAGDAGPDGCTPLLLFRDRDGDGYGSNAEAPEMRCPSEGWVERGGDCFDAVPTVENHAAQVHPEQTSFFSEGYPSPDQPGGVSFDYDCDLEEVADPGNISVASGDCSSASPPCAGVGVGILPEGRSGPGVNGLCGSRTLQTCLQVTETQCMPQIAQAPRAFNCH